MYARMLHVHVCARTRRSRLSAPRSDTSTFVSSFRFAVCIRDARTSFVAVIAWPLPNYKLSIQRTDVGHRGRLPFCCLCNNRTDRDRTMYVHRNSSCAVVSIYTRLTLRDVHAMYSTRRNTTKFYCDLSLERMGKLIQLIGIRSANFFS